MNYHSGSRILDLHRQAQKVAMILIACVILATACMWSIASSQASAAYQGPFCNNKYLYELGVCNSSNFSYSRRVIGHSYKQYTWVDLIGTNCNGGQRCRTAECYSAGCTADTGYYGSYGSGCGSSCAAQIQNIGYAGDWFFGYIYE